MGVVNVTPDSFSDGGKTASAALAIEAARGLITDGADILDIGGESSRPGAVPVSLDEELSRVIPVIEALAGEGACVSVDTRHAPVMVAAMAAGATIINDITALEGDPQSLEIVAPSKASVVLMHMQGDPRTMQEAPVYTDVVAETGAYLLTRIRACQQAGIATERIAIDPGIGFGKSQEHNLDLLRGLSAFTGLECPVVLGVSRKSFIGRLSGEDVPDRRLAGSLAAGLAGVARGASILRVHDVLETRQALDVWVALK
ncbi:MAG: dihydropteroate synthase [Rhodospirillaceae bacterium]|jgi:dihydropteroate synthase|nr:dihydropteroate synthase [Rhodospirillaceae bacterium]MBT5245639.1 dihydropteroate synthase [Rhodospirillaceae bacterium]MBT5562349.1 dihydropteroate synthase [Rhodospirillaceae bacterium]MBT6241577.1 dihydropteroate synthase [Rhodospirillaceae bacterium]MBT7138798.1 dihydropteroate synthase [Rhodospirillaceae bacterium]